jgi:hypothetical protein
MSLSQVQKALEECLLGGLSAHHAAVVDIDHLDGEDWKAVLARAHENAALALDLMVVHRSKVLLGADNLIKARAAPGALRVGVAVMYGKALEPAGKTAGSGVWFSKDKAACQEEIQMAANQCASMLVDQAHRVRSCVIESLSMGVVSQPTALSKAFGPILKALSNTHAAIRADAIAAVRVCMLPRENAVLPRSFVLTIVRMLVDENDNVRHAARRLLADVVKEEGKETSNDSHGSHLERLHHLRTGLVKGWFPNEIDLGGGAQSDDDKRGRDEQVAWMSAGGGEGRDEDEIDARSLVLLLTRQPGSKSAFSSPLTLEQRLSVEAAVAEVLPRGYAPAVKAALCLMHSAGGEGPHEVLRLSLYPSPSSLAPNP